METKSHLYVVKTEKGFVKGDMHTGIEFVAEQELARQFEYDELILYADSMVQDLRQFYKVQSIDLLPISEEGK
jgi:hypothetical protein